MNALRFAGHRAVRRVAVIAAVLLAVAWLGRPWAAEWPQWQARRALVRRDAAAALNWLDWADRLRPSDPETEFLRARAFRKQGKLDLVRVHIERAWELGFPVERLKLEQTLAQAQAGQLREALPHLPELLTNAGEDGPEICEAFVNGYLLDARVDEALRLLASWSADYPNDALPHLVRGKVYARSSQSGRAEKAFREALRLDPSSHEARYELAEVLLGSNRPEAALPLFEQAAAAPQLATGSRVGQARSLRALGRVGQAEVILEKLATRSPPPEAALLELGKVRCDEGRFREAVEILETLHAKRPRDTNVRYALAAALRGLGDREASDRHLAWFKAAQAALTRAYDLAVHVAKEPKDVSARVEIGRTHLQYGNERDGVKWLRGVLDLQPDHPTVHRLLAEYYEAHGEEDPSFARLARYHRERAGGRALPADQTQ